MLPNILKSKDNQTVKLGLLIDYNMRIIFIEKWYKNRGGETSPRPFTEKLRLSIIKIEHISGSIVYSLFLLYAKLKAIEIYSN